MNLRSFFRKKFYKKIFFYIDLTLKQDLNLSIYIFNLFELKFKKKNNSEFKKFLTQSVKKKSKTLSFQEKLINYEYNKNFSSFDIVYNTRQQLFDLDLKKINLPLSLAVPIEFEKKNYENVIRLTKNKNEIMFKMYYFLSCEILKIYSDDYHKKLSFFQKQIKINLNLKEEKILFIGPSNDNFPSYDNETIIIENNPTKFNKNCGKYKIAYFNSVRARNRSDQVLNALDNLDFVVLKSRESYLNQKNIQNLRILPKYDIDRLYGDFNMLPLILIDLIFHQPKEIKISNINFYLDDKIYYDGYRKNNSYKIPSVAKALRIHDPFKNFIFVKNLYEAKLFKASKKVENYLMLSPETYAQKLKILHN